MIEEHHCLPYTLVVVNLAAWLLERWRGWWQVLAGTGSRPHFSDSCYAGSEVSCPCHHALFHSSRTCYTLVHSSRNCDILVHSSWTCHVLVHSSWTCHTVLHAIRSCNTLFYFYCPCHYPCCSWFTLPHAPCHPCCTLSHAPCNDHPLLGGYHSLGWVQ